MGTLSTHSNSCYRSYENEFVNLENHLNLLLLVALAYSIMYSSGGQSRATGCVREGATTKMRFNVNISPGSM